MGARIAAAQVRSQLEKGAAFRGRRPRYGKGRGENSLDVWTCLPDGDDSDTVSDGCVCLMTPKDSNAEFTGIQFLQDGWSFLIQLQHRTRDGRAVPPLVPFGIAVCRHNVFCLERGRAAFAFPIGEKSRLVNFALPLVQKQNRIHETFVVA